MDATKTLADVLEAARFASEKHSSQRRKGPDAEPYVNHVIEVAALLAAKANEPDPALLMAALLHDTVEDAGVESGELKRRFGADVAALVEEVTDNKALAKDARKLLQVINAPALSPRAQCLGAADKICNMRSIFTKPPASWDYQRKREYFEWAKRVVDGFKHLDPKLRTEFDAVYSRFDEMVKPD